MRVVTFTVGAPEDGTECYVSLLRGAAGGVEANVNRWCGQMGRPALTADEMAGLERVEVLGLPASLVELTGDFTGMSGEVQPGGMLLGVLCELPGQTLFVKMTGPEGAVRAEGGRFQAFCESLNADG